jgi:aldehyde:ferredoxin oxidoreductase
MSFKMGTKSQFTLLLVEVSKGDIPMPHGYNGKILHVNLTTGDLTVEEPEEKFYRKYMGGSAMGLYYLLKEMPAGVDPLGPDNMLALCLSVITGTPVSGQSRMTAVAKSPLTGCIGDSQCGGFFPAEMKFAGFDAIIIKGRAEKPVYLWIHEGQAELRDASHLWGRITGEVEATLKKELGDDQIEVLQVGPAGEKKVRFAAIINMSNRANGRTGMGAVMGSKNLKAVVVRGSNKPTLADKEALNELARWGATHFPKSDVAGMGKYGTAETTGAQQQAGGLPSYNFNSGVFDGWEAIDGPTMYDTILRGADQGKQDRYGRDTCYSCSVRCKRIVEITEGPYKVDPHYGGPEYETTSTFGNYCGVSDLAAIAKANEICNKYGMDTISCGATIAWAMECFEEELITVEDTGGIELRFGSAEAIVKMTEMIARREGFGDILAEGSARAAAKIGRGAEEFLITTKNHETPAHMPHTKRSLAVIYAVNPFGADHQSHEHDPSYHFYPERMAQLGLQDPQPKLALNAEMVRYAMITQHLYSAMDSINVCQFVFGPAWQLYDSNQLVQAAQAVTGWGVSLYELMQVGERRLNMLRAFNAREGIGREADTLPKKFFTRPLQGGKTEGYVLDYDEWRQAVDTYYAMCGWDVETGYPTRTKLEALGIGWVADELGL